MSQEYGLMANGAGHDRQRPCLVCDKAEPVFSWTDYSGEGYCLQCGTPYQLKWGELKDGETYPRCNIQAKWIPVLRRYWAETRHSNGAGTFLIGRDYPDQLEGRRLFNEWMEAHEAEYPELKEAI